jgi:hypothetical protein
MFKKIYWKARIWNTITNSQYFCNFNKPYSNRPRPLWKVKRNKHRKHYDSDSDSSSDSASGSTTTSSSSNSSSAKTNRNSDFTEIYEFTCPLSPLAKNPVEENSTTDENNVNIDNPNDGSTKTARSSTSSRDSGFHGGTAPSSPKRALGK